MSAVLASTIAVSDPTEARRQRGLAIEAVSRIEEREAGLWCVPSRSGSGDYWVRLDLRESRCQPITGVDDLQKRLSGIPVGIPAGVVLLCGERRPVRFVGPSESPSSRSEAPRGANLWRSRASDRIGGNEILMA